MVIGEDDCRAGAHFLVQIEWGKYTAAAFRNSSHILGMRARTGGHDDRIEAYVIDTKYLLTLFFCKFCPVGIRKKPSFLPSKFLLDIHFLICISSE
jgi:hypothetical protein